MRQLFLLAVGLAMSLGANAATEHNDIQAVNTPFDHHDNTGPYRKGAELVRHAQNQKRLEGQSTTLAAVESVDVGDVAVIVDNGSILIPPKPSNPFDLGTPSALLFVAGADEFTVSAPGTAFDPGIGGNLGLGDDDATAVEGVDSLTFPDRPDIRRLRRSHHVRRARRFIHFSGCRTAYWRPAESVTVLHGSRSLDCRRRAC
jgi:hypothetical protein